MSSFTLYFCTYKILACHSDGTVVWSQSIISNIWIRFKDYFGFVPPKTIKITKSDQLLELVRTQPISYYDVADILNGINKHNKLLFDKIYNILYR